MILPLAAYEHTAMQRTQRAATHKLERKHSTLDMNGLHANPCLSHTVRGYFILVLVCFFFLLLRILSYVVSVTVQLCRMNIHMC